MFSKAAKITSFLCILQALAGCYTAEAVKPAELPKLNGGFVEPIARTGNATVIAVSVARVEREDGTILEVHGKPDVYLTLRSGTRLDFDGPVLAEADDDSLTLRSENRAKTRVSFKDIEKAEVSQYDGTKTWLAYMGGSLALTGILVAVLVSAK